MTESQVKNSLAWEIAGTIAGLFGCACVLLQIVKEWMSTTPSSLSLGYTIGFLLIFAFWMLYGLRFRRAALWLTNGIAVVLQIVLILEILLK